MSENAKETIPISADPADIDRLLGMQISALLASKVELTIGRSGLLSHLVRAAQYNRIDMTEVSDEKRDS